MTRFAYRKTGFLLPWLITSMRSALVLPQFTPPLRQLTPCCISKRLFPGYSIKQNQSYYGIQKTI